jgi:hypothetical protein
LIFVYGTEKNSTNPLKEIESRGEREMKKKLQLDSYLSTYGSQAEKQYYVLKKTMNENVCIYKKK